MTTTSAAPATKAQVPLRHKGTFPLAEFGSQLVWSTVGSYLLLFYTDVALIAPAVAGGIMLVARVLDGVQDLGFGYIAERTRSRWGRFRPWVMFGAPFLTLTLVMAFVNPATGSTGKIWWSATTYILLCFVYTVVNMAYGSMPGVMTTDTNECLTLNWLRTQGSSLAQIVLNAVTMPLLLLFGSAAAAKGYDSRSFLMMAIIFGVVALPCFIITGANSKEVITLTPEQKKVPFSRTVKAVVGNGPLMLIFCALLLGCMSIFSRLGTLAYYAINNMGDPRLVASVFLAFSVGQMIGGLVFPQFARVLGKMQVLIISNVLISGLLLTIFFLNPHNTTAILVVQFLYGLSNFGQPIIFSMVPDAVDYYEERTGVRADGTSYAAVSLSTKIASAVGASFGMFIIGGFRYDGALAVQSAHTLTGINIAVNLMPAIFSLLAVVPLLFYKLNHQRMAQITASLEAKRAAALAQVGMSAEAGGQDRAEQ
ncbi:MULTISPECIES: glycoside-pentoside-hexuronide (GPH):cation symporter [unclassified Actinomyces]|uniref:MFS transporter n=1 Tax=unclassified Actinomyces TaxID=2609248 RepID=UPI0020182966|nr:MULTISPECIES: glycoside-pentoside-hexuronide (GPH):cation symporter [unclassified Actinomyces]MCL3777444.1 MFS transporter [Actinomyces sp. AC-20-1]MCL3789739.1 MFS transporter [Actinomyces sp. 187325]MCL3792123.1 MFS transporter [Actinomyces sp. 186855]MCL3794793.1 MFS transporter [Actinomyces sp. 217892]